MKERPILFSTPMVQAILDGRKTMTRRIVKGLLPGDGIGRYTTDGEVGEFDFVRIDSTGDPYTECRCPYGQPGDILWVREKWQYIINTYDNKPMGFLHSTDENDGKWRPSIHMPRKAARIFLEVVSVRVERLQEITNSDIVKEGAADFGCCTKQMNWITLWESINGPGSWGKNPLVWVVEFKLTGEELPIDEKPSDK